MSRFSLLLLISTIHVAQSAVCSFENELNSVSWSVNSKKELEIHFEHNNLTEMHWTSLAFGNGPGMNNLEAIIFARGEGDVVATFTAFTPKKKKVDVDDVAYVKVSNVQVNGDKMQITVTRPLGPAGPRKHSLEECVNWIVLPGGALKSKDHFKKHHGGVHIIKNVCAAQCTTGIESMLRSNRISWNW